MVDRSSDSDTDAGDIRRGGCPRALKNYLFLDLNIVLLKEIAFSNH